MPQGSEISLSSETVPRGVGRCRREGDLGSVWPGHPILARPRGSIRGEGRRAHRSAIWGDLPSSAGSSTQGKRRKEHVYLGSPQLPTPGLCSEGLKGHERVTKVIHGTCPQPGLMGPALSGPFSHHSSGVLALLWDPIPARGPCRGGGSFPSYKLTIGAVFLQMPLYLVRGEACGLTHPEIGQTFLCGFGVCRLHGAPFLGARWGAFLGGFRSWASSSVAHLPVGVSPSFSPTPQVFSSCQGGLTPSHSQQPPPPQPPAGPYERAVGAGSPLSRVGDWLAETLAGGVRRDNSADRGEQWGSSLRCHS